VIDTPGLESLRIIYGAVDSNIQTVNQQPAIGRNPHNRAAADVQQLAIAHNRAVRERSATIGVEISAVDCGKSVVVLRHSSQRLGTIGRAMGSHDPSHCRVHINGVPSAAGRQSRYNRHGKQQGSAQQHTDNRFFQKLFHANLLVP
jgi:hypothetical protein